MQEGGQSLEQAKAHVRTPHLCGSLLVVRNGLRLRHTTCKSAQRQGGSGDQSPRYRHAEVRIHLKCSTALVQAQARDYQQYCSSLGHTHCPAARQRSIHDPVLQLEARPPIRGEQLIGVRHYARFDVCGSAAHDSGALAAPMLPGRAQERAQDAHSSG